MTASARLSTRLATETRSAPAPLPPALVPPTAPALRGQRAAAPVNGRSYEMTVSHRSAPRPSRVVSLLAAVAVTLAVVAGLGWLGQGAEPAIPERTAVIRVGAGETIWDVAARVAPQSDQRAVVQRIRLLNGIVGAELVPDQQLQVPDGR